MHLRATTIFHIIYKKHIIYKSISNNIKQWCLEIARKGNNLIDLEHKNLF